MRFKFTREQDEFREDVRSFLDNMLTPEFWAHRRQHRLPGWSPEFSRATAERGWLAPSWPVEYGAVCNADAPPASATGRVARSTR